MSGGLESDEPPGDWLDDDIVVWDMFGYGCDLDAIPDTWTNMADLELRHYQPVWAPGMP